MKPRRWYSSPEVNPHPTPPPARPFPAQVYWQLTTRTRLEQGPIIRPQPPATVAPQRRGAAPRATRPPRRIEVA